MKYQNPKTKEIIFDTEKLFPKLTRTPYNQFGCGYRLLFLVIYNRKRWTSRRHEGQYSIHLNRGLNRLVEYWNHHGNTNGRNLIIQREVWVPIDTLGVINEKDCQALETESYGYLKREYLKRSNLYYRETPVMRSEEVSK